jgi:hypothetical protein
MILGGAGRTLRLYQSSVAADELTPFVEKLAHRIASFPAHAIAHAKAAVDTGAFSSWQRGFWWKPMSPI